MRHSSFWHLVLDKIIKLPCVIWCALCFDGCLKVIEYTVHRGQEASGSLQLIFTSGPPSGLIHWGQREMLL